MPRRAMAMARPQEAWVVFVCWLAVALQGSPPPALLPPATEERTEEDGGNEELAITSTDCKPSNACQILTEQPAYLRTTDGSVAVGQADWKRQRGGGVRGTDPAALSSGCGGIRPALTLTVVGITGCAVDFAASPLRQSDRVAALR